MGSRESQGTHSQPCSCLWPSPTGQPPIPALTPLQGRTVTAAALPRPRGTGRSRGTRPGCGAKWEEVSLEPGTCFLGAAAAAPAPSLGLGRVSPAGMSAAHVGREAWSAPCLLLFHHTAPAHPSTGAGRTEHPASPSEGWVGQGGRAPRQEEGRVAAPGAEQLPASAEQQHHLTDPFSS